MKRLQYKYCIAILIACVFFLDRMDLTIVNIILPTLSNALHTTFDSASWVSTSFLLALAISIPISKWLGDRFGLKKIFILSIILFGLFSGLCAAAKTIQMIVVCRFLQGIGGGLLLPIGATLLYRAFEPKEYASITSYIFLPTLIAPAIGPGLGALIAQLFGWKMVFLFAAPICAVLIIAGMVLLKDDQEERILQPLDYWGFLLASASLLSILYALAQLGEMILTLRTLIYFIAAFIFCMLFIRYERKVQHPLLDLRLFQSKLFCDANWIQLFFQMSHLGTLFLIGMYLQLGVGIPILTVGLMMGMQAISAMCVSRYSVYLFNKMGPRIPIVTGFIGIAIFSVSILFVDHQHIIVGFVLLFARGLFSGLCGTPIQTISVIGIDQSSLSSANALFNVGRQFAISLGISVSAVLIAVGFKLHQINPLDHGVLTHLLAVQVFAYAFAAIVIFCTAGVLIAANIDQKSISTI
ncbi:MAG: MFS transporter [Gammaproteobacteria bacterium]|nr:MFS transporter [Gammaproteobacteria bacterium]